MVYQVNGTSLMWSALRKFDSKRPISQWARLAQCYDKAPPKVPLMIRENERNAAIRCGVIHRATSNQPLPTFLGALLADVYATDQTWLVTLLNRQGTPKSSPLLIKFGEQFDANQDKNLTEFAVPSPFLKEHNLEFLEVPSKEMQDGDGCHFYIDLSDGSANIPHKWPTVTVSDNERANALPLSNQINSSLAVKGILGFIRDKTTVNSYLLAMDKSNVTSFADGLKRKVDDRKRIFSDLGLAILKNLRESDRSLVGNNPSQAQKHEMIEEIQEWRRNAHEELQTVVVPLLTNFLKSHLSIWKIYLYSEDKFSLRLKELIDEPLRDLKMVNFLYNLRGRLQIEGPTESPLQNVHFFDKEITLAHQELNKVIYDNFLKLQLPLIILATVGYVSEQFSLYSMGSLASLGIVLGMQKVISSWEVASKKIVDNMYEAIRIYIEHESNLMVKLCEEKCTKNEAEYKLKQEVIQTLSHDLRK